MDKIRGLQLLEFQRYSVGENLLHPNTKVGEPNPNYDPNPGPISNLNPNQLADSIKLFVWIILLDMEESIMWTMLLLEEMPLLTLFELTTLVRLQDRTVRLEMRMNLKE